MSDLKLKCKCGAIHTITVDDDDNIVTKANYSKCKTEEKTEKRVNKSKTKNASSTANKIKYFISGNEDFLPSIEEEEE